LTCRDRRRSFVRSGAHPLCGAEANHSGNKKPKGALDVSDFKRFGELMERCPPQPRIVNALGAQDPNRFSATGR
jgi:hypothetical protein